MEHHASFGLPLDQGIKYGLRLPVLFRHTAQGILLVTMALMQGVVKANDLWLESGLHRP